MVIAIDGPSGVGKTTITRRVAATLGLDYLDTGSTYRAATVAVLRSGASLSDAAAVVRAVRDSVIDYIDGTIRLNDENIADETRSESVTQAVTPVSAIPEVRNHVVALQRAWVAKRGGSATSAWSRRSSNSPCPANACTASPKSSGNSISPSCA